MENKIKQQLADYNKISKESDILYHEYAIGHALSDTTLWIFYSVIQGGKNYTQRELCSDWFFPPQTINTALKALERKGLVKLLTCEGNKKNKYIVITEAGEKLAKEKVFPVIKAEENAIMKMSEEERDTFIFLTIKHEALLKEELEKLN